jgi:hypothetical protein
MTYDGGVDTVEHALELLGRALSILDDENLLVAAAKVDEVRTTLREFAALG